MFSTMHSRGFALLLCAVTTVACGESGGTTEPIKLVVTTDWFNHSLSLLDFAKLTDGQSTGAEALVRTIDLSGWEPGPLEVEITPDGKTAVVSVGPGFLSILPAVRPIPDGGALLLVDLASGTATEVETAHVPMGIAISPDGTRAYSANYGESSSEGSTMSVIDLTTATNLVDIEVGSRPEQVALSPDGTLGIINLTSGSIRVFQTSDPAGTLSDPVATGSDPSGVTFLGSNDRAVVANSISRDLVLIDTSAPNAPTVVDGSSITVELGPYGVTYVPNRDQILAPNGLTGELVTIDVNGDSLSIASTVAQPGGAFPLVTATGTQDTYGFTAHLIDHQLSIIDLTTGSIRAVSWLTAFGPTYAAVQP